MAGLSLSATGGLAWGVAVGQQPLDPIDHAKVTRMGKMVLARLLIMIFSVALDVEICLGHASRSRLASADAGRISSRSAPKRGESPTRLPITHHPNCVNV
jgi:hypothetical protein